MNDYFFPKLTAVEALAPYRLRTLWNTGEELEVDVSTRLKNHPALAAILDPEVFDRVHIGEWGNSIEWIDEEFGADNVYAWAKEQAGEVSHEIFDEWMRRNGLSLTTAAEALGISRRMVSYYRTAHKAIPRAIWLACLGWEATRPTERTLPRALPTAREYAALHA
ncbi:MAG: DUF2442 domain-containing protein [Propionivibrio sp.]|uniref:DUF2442 domain-containing protein n=1 Tax=Candidatus Propionivibrio dominans TaxID=2954373 RepID=A0A9D7F7J7_9RHOO|nr:DUF2442 domain-containing protein [Candidatus Propionivibrio dominans]MBL0166896.1 DUF2442 domain-containing protein [Propionivibrio sp.]